jgi:hypothetical protein
MILRAEVFFLELEEQFGFWNRNIVQVVALCMNHIFWLCKEDV